MKLWLYVRGQQAFEEPDKLRIKKGALFCTIECIGDGTPGETTYYYQTKPFPAEPEWCAQQRVKIERCLSVEEVHYFVSGGQILSQGRTICYDSGQSSKAWTREHFEHGIMLDLRDDFLFEWSEDPTDRVMKAFPKKPGTSPVPVRGRRNKPQVE